MEGDERFFNVTKKIHNALHGRTESLTGEDREVYAERTRQEAQRLELDGDLILIHDPQPAGLIALRRAPGQRWVWRCHIDLSSRDPDHWEFLRPSVSQYDASIFSAIEFVPPLTIPTYLVPPSIDPFSAKNREMEPDEVGSVLERHDLPRRGPWVTQVSRFDRIKDPIGVIEAFRMVRARRRARLLLAGGGASDDPEGAPVLAEGRERAEKVKDVTVLELPPGSDVGINALHGPSTVVMRKPLREGFALTVPEALWSRHGAVARAGGR